YLVEDRNGNRVAEFHNARGLVVQLVHPAHAGVLYLRNVGSGREYEVPPTAEGELRVSALASRSAPARARGAAHHAFSLIFSLPFDPRLPADAAVSAPAPAPAVARPAWRTRAALGAFAVAAVAGATATGLALSSR